MAAKRVETKTKEAESFEDLMAVKMSTSLISGFSDEIGKEILTRNGSVASNSEADFLDTPSAVLVENVNPMSMSESEPQQGPSTSSQSQQQSSSSSKFAFPTSSSSQKPPPSMPSTSSASLPSASRNNNEFTFPLASDPKGINGGNTAASAGINGATTTNKAQNKWRFKCLNCKLGFLSMHALKLHRTAHESRATSHPSSNSSSESEAEKKPSSNNNNNEALDFPTTQENVVNGDDDVEEPVNDGEGEQQQQEQQEQRRRPGRPPKASASASSSVKFFSRVSPKFLRSHRRVLRNRKPTKVTDVKPAASVVPFKRDLKKIAATAPTALKNKSSQPRRRSYKLPATIKCRVPSCKELFKSKTGEYKHCRDLHLTHIQIRGPYNTKPKPRAIMKKKTSAATATTSASSSTATGMRITRANANKIIMRMRFK